jgi:DNA processing protein
MTKNVKCEKDLIFWHAFNSVENFGPQTFRKLAARFSTLQKAWRSDRSEILAAGISQKQTEKFLEFRKNYSPEELFSELAKEKVGMITINCEAYPPQLKEIDSAPPVLYIRGEKEILANKSIAVVGSRKSTDYGRRVTENLCRDLVRAGLAIVSGLALGIDGIAHQATLDNEGITIAVLGTGIDDETIYPREHFNLAQDILSGGGTIISEFPPKTPSLKQNFPARNRIMAGLALGTLVAEAAESSGSLITAGLALEFGREVFAVPGDIFSPQSAGANYLIKNGAKLVSSSADILEELNISRPAAASPQKIFEPKTKEEKIIWKILSNEPLHVDKIAKITKLDTATVSATLGMMEIENVIRDVGGKNYIKL